MLSNQNSSSSAVFSRRSRFIVLSSVILLALVPITFFGIVKFRQMNNQYQEASLVLVFNNGEPERMFVGKVINGMTVLQCLIASSRAGQIEFQYHIGSDDRVVIEKLDGYTKDPNAKFAIYLNGVEINIPDIGRTFIRGGDRIEIRPL